MKATARSQFPLAKAELVHNGKVIATATLADDKLTRDAGPGGGARARRLAGVPGRAAPGPRTPPTSALNAHTNPVYVEAGGVAYRSAEEARAFLKWIDQFELLLRTRDRFPTAKHRTQAQEQIEAARQVYARIIRDARE